MTDEERTAYSAHFARKLREAADQVEREQPSMVELASVRARIAEVPCPGPEKCAHWVGPDLLCGVVHRELLPGMASFRIAIEFGEVPPDGR